MSEPLQQQPNLPPVQPAAEAPMAPMAPPAAQAVPVIPEPMAEIPVQPVPQQMPPVEDAAGYAAEPAYPQEHDYITGDMSHLRPVPRVSIQAFCESQNVAGTIEKAGQDRRMEKAHLSVQLGGIPAAVEFYQTTTTPNLILLESGLSGGDLIAQLEQLAEVCDEGTNVVVIGHTNDVQLYRELISRGVAEYLVAPVSMADVIEIASTLFVNPEAEPLGQSIAFIGAKGGVGSSTIAHNVAWTIASDFMSDVILADLDLAFGTANIDFDKDPPQGVAEAVFSSDRIDETFLDRLLEKCSDHLSLLAAPSTLDRDYDFDPPDFTQLLEIAQRGTPNVIIDLPHMWTGWVRQVLSSADKVVVTATPDLACLRNTKNLIDTLVEARPNDDKPFLVINQCNVPKRPEISVDDFCQPLDLDPTTVIAFEPALFGTASNNGQMISEADPKHEVSDSLEQLSQILTGRREIQSKSSSSLGSFFSRLVKKS